MSLLSNDFVEPHSNSFNLLLKSRQLRVGPRGAVCTRTFLSKQAVECSGISRSEGRVDLLHQLRSPGSVFIVFSEVGMKALCRFAITLLQ